MNRSENKSGRFISSLVISSMAAALSFGMIQNPPVRAGEIRTAAEEKKPEQVGEPVELDKLPKAVVDGVKKAMPGARIVKAAKLPDGNYFLDDVKVGKKEYDVTVTPEGKVLKSVEQKDAD